MPYPNLAVGDVVILKDNLSSPNKWPSGLIVAVYSDDQGFVRNVDVRFNKNTKRRNITNLIPIVRDNPSVVTPGAC